MLDDFMHQAGLRTGGKAVKMPPVSRLLENLARDNGLNLLKKTDRDRLLKFVVLLQQKAPVIHISLASEPSAAALGKLLQWMRVNIHPQVLVSIGVQPAIAAGCLVRTANREFDFSLRKSLEVQSALLIKNIRAGEGQAAPAANAPAEPPKEAAAKPVTKVEVK